MKLRYAADLKLLCTDTDSPCYQISCEDIYGDMLKTLDYYDTSNYPLEHKIHIVFGIKKF